MTAIIEESDGKAFWNSAGKYTNTNNDESFATEMAYVLVTLHKNRGLVIPRFNNIIHSLCTIFTIFVRINRVKDRVRKFHAL